MTGGTIDVGGGEPEEEPEDGVPEGLPDDPGTGDDGTGMELKEGSEWCAVTTDGVTRMHRPQVSRWYSHRQSRHRDRTRDKHRR